MLDHGNLTALQAQTFQHLINGSDLVGRARTVCGKTLAFVLPIVEKLKETLGPNGRRPFGRTPSVIVLLPTRELAKQVSLVALTCNCIACPCQRMDDRNSSSTHHAAGRGFLLSRLHGRA